MKKIPEYILFNKEGSTTQNRHALNRGKWSLRDVPHKGWVYVNTEDLEESQIECEMCESQMIRYVHEMKHPNYPGVLKVGCICASHMEENPAASKKREADLKRQAGKKKRLVSISIKYGHGGNLKIFGKF